MDGIFGMDQIEQAVIILLGNNTSVQEVAVIVAQTKVFADIINLGTFHDHHPFRAAAVVWPKI